MTFRCEVCRDGGDVTEIFDKEKGGWLLHCDACGWERLATGAEVRQILNIDDGGRPKTDLSGQPLRSVRHTIPHEETMLRLFTAMENALYAAEIAAHEIGCREECAYVCPFIRENGFCGLKQLRNFFGDHSTMRCPELDEKDDLTCCQPLPSCENQVFDGPADGGTYARCRLAIEAKATMQQEAAESVPERCK